MDQAKSVRIARDSVPVEKFTLTLDGEGLSSTPIAGEIEKNTEVTIKVKVPENNEIDTFTVGGVDKKSELVNNEYKFNIISDTTVEVTYKEIPLGIKTVEKLENNDIEGLSENESITVNYQESQNKIVIGGTIPKYSQSILGHDTNSNLFGIKITLNSVNKETAACKIVGTKANTYPAEDNWIDDPAGNYFYFVGAVKDTSSTFTITIDNDGDWDNTKDDQVSYNIVIASNTTIE
ncbi:hypothetical protein [Sporanaerobacter sp. PP17-6a]|uniref:hypothetical protein n=1 Tax=Sporanaerobacter sp. PP17-6a TaxID=1891289 RepID=UPI0008A0320D|nr:hypothetical protein [Sporanaerobacter sp. PP17-6a]SCL87039.1 hypothetical protein PP176A_1214 [Sporanaerobacter sp. PP17-6a]